MNYFRNVKWVRYLPEPRQILSYISYEDLFVFVVILADACRFSRMRR